MSKTLWGPVALFAYLSHWGVCVITTADQLCHLRWKTKFWLISVFRFYEFLNVNTQKINSTLKLHGSSRYVIKSSIFNAVCFRHQLILRGNNQTASSRLLQYRRYHKINRNRPHQGANHPFALGYEDELTVTLQRHWAPGLGSSIPSKTTAAGCVLRKKATHFFHFPTSHNSEYKANTLNKSERKPRKVQSGAGGSLKCSVSIRRGAPQNCLCTALMLNSSYPTCLTCPLTPMMLLKVLLCAISKIWTPRPIHIREPVKPALRLASSWTRPKPECLSEMRTNWFKGKHKLSSEFIKRRIVILKLFFYSLLPK